MEKKKPVCIFAKIKVTIKINVFINLYAFKGLKFKEVFSTSSVGVSKCDL